MACVYSRLVEPMHTQGKMGGGLLSPAEAAIQLGISVDTIRRWADSGLIPVVVLPSGHRRFRTEDVQAIMQQAAS